MPRFKIETSLFEPVTIEVEGGRTYASVPLSPFLIREMSKLEEQRKAKTLDDFSAITQQVALIFGEDVSEIEKIDVRILQKILTYATEAMSATAEKTVPSEAQAEKNVPLPGSETLQ